MNKATFRRITAHPTTVTSAPGASTPQPADIDRQLSREALVKSKGHQPPDDLASKLALLEKLIEKEEADEQAKALTAPSDDVTVKATVRFPRSMKSRPDTRRLEVKIRRARFAKSRSRRSPSVQQRPADLPSPVTHEASRPVLSPAERLTRVRSMAHAIEPRMYLAVADQLRGHGETVLRQSFRQIEIRLARFQHMSGDRPSRRKSAGGVLNERFPDRSVVTPGLNRANENAMRREANRVLEDVRQLSDEFKDAGLDASPLKQLETKLEQIMQDAFPDYSYVPGGSHTSNAFTRFT